MGSCGSRKSGTLRLYQAAHDADHSHAGSAGHYATGTLRELQERETGQGSPTSKTQYVSLIWL